MADEWIEKLAAELREKNREAAQAYGRQQHFAGVIARLGPEFFLRLTSEIERSIDLLRRRLQGDVVAAETTVQTTRPGELRITRERFPWVDANVIHRDETITVDCARSSGLPADPQLGRQSRVFTMRAAPDDTLYAEEGFGDRPARYESPEDLARAILELLFAA